MRLSCVVDNSVGSRTGRGSVMKADGHFLSEHGLSMLLETDGGARVLLDTGSSQGVLANNLACLGVAPRDLDLVFITHGHYDHLGGLPMLLREGVPCHTHPMTFGGHRFSVSGGRRREIGASPELMEALRAADMSYDDGPRELVKGVWSSGEIARNTSFESPRDFSISVDGEERADPIREEMSLCVPTRKGLVIITGCGHAGVVNIVSQFKRRADRKPYLVIGGFHLAGATQDVLLRTMDGLKGLGVEKVAPMHCTGFEACKMFSDRFPGFELFGSGSYIDI